MPILHPDRWPFIIFSRHFFHVSNSFHLVGVKGRPPDRWDRCGSSHRIGVQRFPPESCHPLRASETLFEPSQIDQTDISTVVVVYVCFLLLVGFCLFVCLFGCFLPMFSIIFSHLKPSSKSTPRLRAGSKPQRPCRYTPGLPLPRPKRLRGGWPHKPPPGGLESGASSKNSRKQPVFIPQQKHMQTKTKKNKKNKQHDVEQQNKQNTSRPVAWHGSRWSYHSDLPVPSGWSARNVGLQRSPPPELQSPCHHNAHLGKIGQLQMHHEQLGITSKISLQHLPTSVKCTTFWTISTWKCIQNSSKFQPFGWLVMFQPQWLEVRGPGPATRPLRRKISVTLWPKMNCARPVAWMKLSLGVWLDVNVKQPNNQRTKEPKNKEVYVF